MEKQIRTALISVFDKEGLVPIVNKLHALGVNILSTGGTQAFIEERDIPVTAIESLTDYPAILDGRVKTLHPKVFGGILARREPAHLEQLEQYDIPEIDLVIVDLYPFEETLAQTQEDQEIIEKIDIGGISLIRAAAKNYADIVVVPSRAEYPILLDLLAKKAGKTDLADRKQLARRAFRLSAHYDTAIFQYFSQDAERPLGFLTSAQPPQTLRYGENPHQQGFYHGPLEDLFEQLHGKAISYNNLIDIDAALGLMAEFQDASPTFAVLKHTNSCGLATRPTLQEAWTAALAGDNVSAFGGILIANRPVDKATAEAIDAIFYEVLLAPEFKPDALETLKKKKNRILLRVKHFNRQQSIFRSILNGVIEQDADLSVETAADWELMTAKAPTPGVAEDLVFANKCVKHLKSNAIALVKNQQLVGIGCGQTSRVDAMQQAVAKAHRFGFDLRGAVMASDAFFPFPDTVAIAHEAGIQAVIQPGGSIRDQDSIDYCDEHGLAMVKTGVRHFKH